MKDIIKWECHPNLNTLFFHIPPFGGLDIGTGRRKEFGFGLRGQHTQMKNKKTYMHSGAFILLPSLIYFFVSDSDEFIRLHLKLFGTEWIFHHMTKFNSMVILRMRIRSNVMDTKDVHEKVLSLWQFGSGLDDLLLAGGKSLGPKINKQQCLNAGSGWGLV